MRLKNPAVAAVVVVAALFSPGGLAPVTAQESLAEVARREQERRQSIKQAAKVLTNKDLGAVPAIAPPPATATTPAADGTTPAAEAGTDGATAAPAPADGAKPGPEPARDQAYWSSRAKELQGQLTRNETFAVALQSRINALANEYTNQSDPIQQAAVASERQKSIDELNRLTRQIADDKTAIATLQEDARRAGVPPGWLR